MWPLLVLPREAAVRVFEALSRCDVMPETANDRLSIV
jgi:hypothetical protein